MSELRGALRAATEAALAAGDLLRRESWREGGPRGHGDHADVDDEAEALIRARLLHAFPRWSYFGEETGQHVTDEPATFWLVDPNDGTAAYLRGHRASAVSIALIRGGQPVLGVVYAPCYPDDRGDLIAWAEGAGPPRRNDVDVETTPLPDRLDPHHVVLVSQDADTAPEGNLRCCAPARYRALPSIAYRLALVAVGEGEAAVSLAGAGWLDFAGGHALLRARGGTVTDEAGSPIHYASVGNRSVTWCFGGSSAVCNALARRDWRDVRRGARYDGSLVFPVQLPTVRRRVAPEVLSRAQGCLLGQLAGDALGSRVEFEPSHAIRARHATGPRELIDGGTWNTIAGQPTDDSELALALARTLVAHGRWETSCVFAAYQEWYRSRPFDVGATTADALSRPSYRHPGTRSESQANGSLMRISPLGIAAHVAGDRAMDWARDDSSLTHPHPVCQEACAVFVRAIASGLAGASRQEMYRDALEASTLLTREALERASLAPPPEFGRQMGWVLIALHNAFYRLLHASSLEEAVVETVREGGDTDTNAAIAGALAGAWFGRSGVPDQWRRALASCRPHPAYERAVHPRPPWCWPVDALEIAERLLTLAEGSSGKP